MSKFFFRRKRKETIEPATSGEISEADLLKDVQKMKKESRSSMESLEREAELDEEIDWVGGEPEDLDREEIVDKYAGMLDIGRDITMDEISEAGEPDIDDFIIPKEVKPDKLTKKHIIIEKIPTKPVEEEIKKSPEINIDADDLRKELTKLKEKENGFPDVENKISMKDMWIDATPDDQYALRILKAYRKRCDEKWMIEGFSKERRLLYDAMNEHQEQRAKELDRAIALLEKKQI